MLAIGQLTQVDLAAATELFVRTFNAPPWNDSWTTATAGKRLTDLMRTPQALGVVARDGGVIGFAVGTLEQSDAHLELNLREMCVARDRQRSGVGRRLLRALHQLASEAGAVRGYLQTARGGDAAAFYEAHGYRPAFRQHIFVTDDLDLD